MRIGLFQWNDHRFALPFKGLQRVLGSPHRHLLPLMGAWYSGVILDAGQLVPCFDLGRWIGHDETPLPTTWFCAVYATEFGELGIPATVVIGVLEEQGGQVLPAEPGEDLLGAGEVFLLEGKRYPILNIDMMVRSMTCA